MEEAVPADIGFDHALTQFRALVDYVRGRVESWDENASARVERWEDEARQALRFASEGLQRERQQWEELWRDYPRRMRELANQLVPTAAEASDGEVAHLELIGRLVGAAAFAELEQRVLAIEQQDRRPAPDRLDGVAQSIAELEQGRENNQKKLGALDKRVREQGQTTETTSQSLAALEATVGQVVEHEASTRSTMHDLVNKADVAAKSIQSLEDEFLDHADRLEQLLGRMGSIEDASAEASGGLADLTAQLSKLAGAVQSSKSDIAGTLDALAAVTATTEGHTSKWTNLDQRFGTIAREAVSTVNDSVAKAFAQVEELTDRVAACEVRTALVSDVHQSVLALDTATSSLRDDLASLMERTNYADEQLRQLSGDLRDARASVSAAHAEVTAVAAISEALGRRTARNEESIAAGSDRLAEVDASAESLQKAVAGLKAGVRALAEELQARNSRPTESTEWGPLESRLAKLEKATRLPDALPPTDRSIAGQLAIAKTVWARDYERLKEQLERLTAILTT